MMNYSDLIERDIIDLQNGENIGQFNDVEIDIENGKITSLYIEEAGKIFGVLGKNRIRKINWKDIVKVGMDVIVVNVTTEVNKDTKNSSV